MPWARPNTVGWSRKSQIADTQPMTMSASHGPTWSSWFFINLPPACLEYRPLFCAEGRANTALLPIQAAT